MTDLNDQEREVLEAAYKTWCGGDTDVPRLEREAFEDGYEAAIAAREGNERPQREKPGSSYHNPIHVSNEEIAQRMAAREEPRFDQVTISREEFEQIRRAQGFALFVSALDRPSAASTRRKITLERLIEKAKDTLAGTDAILEDTERPDERLRGALMSVGRAYHDMAHKNLSAGVAKHTHDAHESIDSFDICPEVMCVNVHRLLRDTEQ